MTAHHHHRAAELALLQERARRLAAPLADDDATDALQLLEFTVADERYAFEAHEVDDVQPLRELTPLPGSRPFWRGLVNIRGRIVPVIDLREFFGLPDQGIDDLHRILLFRREDLEVGLLADTVDGVAGIEPAAVRAPLSGFGRIDRAYIRGIAPDRRVILDAKAILDDPRILLDETVS